MPTVSTWQSNYPVERPVKATLDNLARLSSRQFDSAYYTITVQNQNYAEPGLVVALNTDSGKYVPFESGAAYGTGSDTAVGVIDQLLVLSVLGEASDVGCAPIYHGELVEAFCFEIGQTLGTISAGVKTDLPGVQWK